MNRKKIINLFILSHIREFVFLKNVLNCHENKYQNLKIKIGFIFYINFFLIYFQFFWQAAWIKPFENTTSLNSKGKQDLSYLIDRYF